ncbi:hypothetical protein [uncultured Kordia sp.]|uniref:hypothetical protein n=1 Tax=uncultured Kordia sp. TaxID=507699 RepID=UPI0026028E3B|nr:hypothetical protein [uncultured Kordia sp.]
MTVIEEFIEKYNYQKQNKIVLIDGSRISIHITEVSDATRTAEPTRIKLYLDKVYQTTFAMYPKNMWNHLISFLSPKKNSFIPQAVKRQFDIKGDEKICEMLVVSKIFVESILDEQIYILTKHKKVSEIILTPAHGINNVEHLEKLITILKQIEYSFKHY